MSSSHDPRRAELHASLSRAFRRLERRESGNRGFWNSLRLLGSVGWPIVGLTAGGAWAGHWLDRRFQTGPFWALVLVVCGAIVGCWTAWRNVRPQ